jgi:PadR family transcriptional regulator, regulatory protein PadR
LQYKVLSQYQARVDHDDPQDKWQVQLRKGALELVILAALRERPVYGLALLRHLQRLPTTAITEGTLYPLLDRLKRDELVSANWVQEGETRPRKYYQLTPKGVHKLAALTRAWQQSVTDINTLLTLSVDAALPTGGLGDADA